MRKIGIIGGMGPEATSFLFQKIIASTKAKDDADHIPLLIDNNPQIPSRIQALIEKTGPSPLPVLIGMAQGLEQAGCSAIAIPCNTAHAYAEAIASAIHIPLINMISLTAKTLSLFASEKGLTEKSLKVGMLASPASRMAQVFEADFNQLGIAPIYLNEDKRLLTIIRAVKAGEPLEDLGERLNHLANEMIEKQGCDILLVACTELSLLMPWLKQPHLMDSLDVLTKAIIEFSQQA